MMEPNDLRFRILQEFINWGHSGSSEMLDAGQLAKTLRVNLNDIIDQFDILEGMNAVKVQRAFGDVSNHTALITGLGKSIFEESIAHRKNSSPELAIKETNSDITMNINDNQIQVFVVHGRDDKLRQSMFLFLRAIGLKPIEWNQAIAATGKTSPYIGEILDAAFKLAKAIIVLASGDDEAKLANKFAKREDPEYEKNLTPQPRPNVLFEAGLAMGRDQNRTILVEVGNLRPWSDIAGRHITHLDNTPEKRRELAEKLRVAGCEIDTSGQEWLEIGDFGELPNEPPTKEITIQKIVEVHSENNDLSITTENQFTGTGSSNTRPFTISSSPWKLRYRVNWNGHFAVQVRGKNIELVINKGVTAGKVYETYVHDQLGNLYFCIRNAPPDGEWTLWIT